MKTLYLRCLLTLLLVLTLTVGTFLFLNRPAEPIPEALSPEATVMRLAMVEPWGEIYQLHSFYYPLTL